MRYIATDEIGRTLTMPEAILAVRGTPLAGLKPCRGSEEEITLFKSVGNAVDDLALAGLVIG